VWTIAAAVDEMSASQEGIDFGGGEGVAGFDGGFAGHHVEHFVQELLLIQIEGFLLAAFQKLGEELGGVETLQEAGECVDGDGIGADCGSFDAEAFDKRLNLFEHFLLAAAGGESDRDQQALAFQRTARNARQQVFVHDAFMKGVLIDDDQAVIAFGDEITVMKLDRRRRFAR
jgi:hypothetical protein